MSNFPKSADKSRVNAPLDTTSTFSFESYIANTQLNAFGGASSIFVAAKFCLRSWFTAHFIEEFDLQEPGHRCAAEQAVCQSLWSDLDEVITWLIGQPESQPSGDDKMFEGAFAKKVYEVFGPTSYVVDELKKDQMRLRSWFQAMPKRWEDKADNCSSYDHGISFCYFDDLLDHLILFYQDNATGIRSLS